MSINSNVESRPRLHIVSVAFCGVGDQLPLHNVLLAAAERGHRVTIGVESQEHCGAAVWPVPAHLKERMRFELFLDERAPVTKHPGLAGMFTNASMWFEPLTSMARGEQSDIQTTNYVQQHAVMPIYRPTGLFIANHVRAALAANDGFRPVVVAHTMFQNAMDVAALFNVPFVSLWASPLDITDLPGHLCGGQSTAELQSSLWARLRALLCIADLVWNTAIGDGDVIRRALIAELGGDPSTLPSTMAAMSSCRQIQSTVAGFERPVALSPLVTQVGALVHSVDANALLVDASAWHARLVAPFLAANADKRVIVLAFGSTAVPTPPFVDALVDASVALLRKRADLRIIVAASWRTSEFHRSIERYCGAAEQADATLLCERQLLLAKWIVQRVVIAQPNVALLGSHCGWGSLSEALYYGKPVLAYPFAFDQADNAQRAVEWGAAVRIDRRSADAATIGVALEQLLDNSSYAIAAQRWRHASIFAGGTERAVDVIETEALVGHAHLMPNRNVSFIDAISLVIILALAITFFCLRLCCRRCCRNAETKKKRE
jgi:hypothetical protein